MMLFEMQILMYDKLADFVYTLLYCTCMLMLIVFIMYSPKFFAYSLAFNAYSPGWSCSSRNIHLAVPLIVWLPMV